MEEIADYNKNGTSNNAMRLRTLRMGLIAGPAASLHGSPTVSPVIAAWCAGEPLPPRCPSSIYFLALSQAAPPVQTKKANIIPELTAPINAVSWVKW